MGALGCISRLQTSPFELAIRWTRKSFARLLNLNHALILHGTAVAGVFSFWTIYRCLIWESVINKSIESLIFWGDIFKIYNLKKIGQFNRVGYFTENVSQPSNWTASLFVGEHSDLWLHLWLRASSRLNSASYKLDPSDCLPRIFQEPNRSNWVRTDFSALV